MEVFLVLNGLEINASIEEQESVILALASSEIDREGFTEWLRTHIQEMKGV